MLFKRGKVFLADLDKSLNDNVYEIRGKRPVLILTQNGEDLVEVIPISSNVREGLSDRYSMQLLLQGTTKYISLMCDKLITIPTKCLVTEIGEIDSESMDLIMQKTKSPKTVRRKEEGPNHTLSVNIYADKISDIQEYIFETQNDIKEIKTQIVNMNSQKEKWKERFIGFIFGIIASVIATIITRQFV